MHISFAQETILTGTILVATNKIYTPVAQEVKLANMANAQIILSTQYYRQFNQLITLT
jgi:hypothetical protein